MKKYLILSLCGLAAVILMLLPIQETILGKGHVVGDQVQVCHQERTSYYRPADNGVAMIVTANSLSFHLRHGDCQLPACDFANVFHAGDECAVLDVDGDGRCDSLNTRDEADTPGCPAGTF